MIPVSEMAAELLTEAGASVRFVRVESWLGDQLLAEDVPITTGAEDQSADTPVERVTFTVPAQDDSGYVWIPRDYAHPLHTVGQRVRVSLGVGVAGGEIEWINRGWFLVYTADAQGSVVQVTCLGLLALVDEAVLPNEYQPKSGATLASVCRALVEPGITIDDDASPADRAVPASSITWSDNRLDALRSVLDAWPAQARMNEDGYLEITEPPDDPTEADVVLTLADGYGGTVVEWGAAVTREGAFNAVVAKGQWPDNHPTRTGQEIIQTYKDSDPGSPYRTGGEFSPYLVPYGYASPLMTTPEQVRKAAKSRMRTLRRNARRSVDVTAVPDPRIQLGDVVAVTSARLGLDAALGVVQSFTLPYLPGDGAMSLTVSLEG